jgi:hypothetical protein
VSASSTTSALCKLLLINCETTCSGEHFPSLNVIVSRDILQRKGDFTLQPRRAKRMQFDLPVCSVPKKSTIGPYSKENAGIDDEVVEQTQ